MLSSLKNIAAKNTAKTAGKSNSNVEIALGASNIALGASLQEQKNRVLGESSASASTSSILGKTGYKKDRQNISGIVLG